jgi:hypothetical protein
MPPAEKLVFPDAVLAVSGPVRVHGHLVDEEHGFPVGDMLHDFFSGHRFRF